MERKYLTIQQAARLLSVTELTLRNWDKAGKFVAARHPINNYRIYTLDQVDALIHKLGKRNTSKKLSVQFIDDDAPEDPTADLG